jgi:hypothetical protein
VHGRLAWRPAGAQVVPERLAVAVDTSKLDLRVTGVTLSSRRSVAGNTPFAEVNGGIRGVEGWVRSKDAGVYARYLTGSFADEAHNVLDARLLLGDERTMFEAGWIRRSRPGQPDSAESVARVGMRLQLPIGGSGAIVYFGGGGYIPVGGAPADTAIKRNTGWDGESGIRYRLSQWKLPLELMVGYRLEYFRGFGRQEEVSSVVLGAGFNLIGR